MHDGDQVAAGAAVRPGRGGSGAYGADGADGASAHLRRASFRYGSDGRRATAAGRVSASRQGATRYRSTSHGRGAGPQLAREDAARFDAASDIREGAARLDAASDIREGAARFDAASDVAQACSRLADAIDGLGATDLDELHDEVVRDLLRRTQRQLDRLTAFRASATAALQSRLVRSAGPGKEQQGIRDTRDFLTNELRLAPSEAKRTERTGSSLRRAPATAASFRAGDVSQEHARIITDTLRHLFGDDRDTVERELLAAAAHQDPVQLGRTARRLLAETDYDAAVTDDQRRHGRRYTRATQTADGGVGINAMLYGVGGELALTALHAFQLPDVAGEMPRSPEQRAADALEAIFDAALRGGTAPERHGVRPHVEIVVQYSDLARQAGIAELSLTGPITLAEVQRLLADSTMCRVVVGPDSMPLEVSRKVRTVPAALWTALKLRDRGCAWSGCSAPPGWCEVAHATTPYRSDGKLSLSNAVLLCKRHHRRFDGSGWSVRIDGPTVTFVPPGGAGNGDPPVVPP